MKFVVDGQDLLDYLRHEGRWSAEDSPRPGIILLDLNMPVDGARRWFEIRPRSAAAVPVSLTRPGREAEW